MFSKVLCVERFTVKKHSLYGDFQFSFLFWAKLVCNRQVVHETFDSEKAGYLQFVLVRLVLEIAWFRASANVTGSLSLKETIVYKNVRYFSD